MRFHPASSRSRPDRGSGRSRARRSEPAALVLLLLASALLQVSLLPCHLHAHELRFDGDPHHHHASVAPSSANAPAPVFQSDDGCEGTDHLPSPHRRPVATLHGASAGGPSRDTVSAADGDVGGAGPVAAADGSAVGPVVGPCEAVRRSTSGASIVHTEPGRGESSPRAPPRS